MRRGGGAPRLSGIDAAYTDGMAFIVEKLLLAAPRGYCAGVDRAVQTVERALELYGAPVYVRKEIVHNKHVVQQLRDRGAIFLQAIDATCPLVTKVHVEAKRFAAQGYTIVLIGHGGHEEVEGTMGEAPDSVVLVETEADVDALDIPDPDKVAYISQTTLSVAETRTIINRLRERFPSITGPRTDDICYATTNRQAAVKQMAAQCDLVLVIGSKNSSNSNRLVDVARDRGAASYLIDNETEVQEEWLEGVRVVGISSGASAPEGLVSRLVDFFRARGTQDVSEFEVLREDVRFMLPKTIRQQRRRGQREAASLGHRLEAELRGERERLGDVVDRAGGHGGGAQGRHPVRGRTPAEHRLEPLGERVRVRDAGGGGGEALVRGEPRQAERLGEPPEQAVVAGRDGDRAVGALVGLVRRDARVAVAAAGGDAPAEDPRRALVEQRHQGRGHERDLRVRP